MIKNYIKTTFAFCLGLSLWNEASAQTPGFTGTDYKKALWMTTRMYGGQRSGDKNTKAANWLLIGHPKAPDGRTFLKDADGTYDLSGGWFDCGDHIKFSHTMFYSAYMLLKGYAEFSKGYDDRYDIDYAGYANSNNYSFEGNGHKPNGIPDILDEAKHATDFIIKCTRDESKFYFQVGDGSDHNKWETAAAMQNEVVTDGGQPRVVNSGPNDGALPSLAGAALALMSRMYKPYDASYAATCLQHAKYAYAYAKAHKGQTQGAVGGFYGINSNPKDSYAALLGELYWATRDESYKTEALAMTLSVAGNADVHGNAYGIDYVNNGDLGAFNLYLLGKSGADKVVQSIVREHYIKQVSQNGLYTKGNDWGTLRYNANAAFVVALWANRNVATDSAKKFIYTNIDYILGKNSKNFSFIVGFNTGPLHPHHRNVFMNDENVDDNAKQKLPIPDKNKQHGYMVGGRRDPNSYQDLLLTYTSSEGGCDYNAGLVGALGWINSQVASVTTNFPAVEIIPTPGTISSVDEVLDITSLIVYPNPSSDGFELNAPENMLVKIFDQMGRVVSEFNTKEQIHFGADFPSGMYHVSFYKDGQLCKSTNVVKQ